MSNPNYRCTNCGVSAQAIPDDECPNCDGFNDDYVLLSDDDEAAARGEAQYDARKEDQLWPKFRQHV